MKISGFKINLFYMLGDIAETSFASTSHANQENVTAEVAYVNSGSLGDVTQPNPDGKTTQVGSNAFTFHTFI